MSRSDGSFASVKQQSPEISAMSDCNLSGGGRLRIDRACDVDWSAGRHVFRFRDLTGRPSTILSSSETVKDEFISRRGENTPQGLY